LAYLELIDVWKSYNGEFVLKGLNLSVNKGELVVILGPSGCGKTTTLKIIAGILPLDRGEIILDDEDITWEPPWKRRIGFVFQNLALFPHMTVKENIAFGLEAKELDKHEIDKRVDELIDLLKLRGLEDRYPREISGGQQQRVAIARALAPYPKILLLDEPFSNLDALLREEMRLELKKIVESAKITTILVTHDQTEAFQIADRIAIMFDGKIVMFDKPENIISRPQSEDVARFLKLNIIKANIVNGKAFLGSQELPCYSSTGKIIVSPNDIVIDDERGQIEAKIISCNYQRFYWRIIVELFDGQQIEIITNKKPNLSKSITKISIKKCASIK